MKLISLKVKWFKNLDFWDNPIDFTKSEWISIFVWNNWSWKSNVLEAISAIFYGLYDDTNYNRCDFTYIIEYVINNKKIKIQQLFFRGKKEAIWILPDDFLKTTPDAEEIRVVSCYVDGKYVWWNVPVEYLPYNIISLYSWEETRLYENFFQEYYQDFITSVKNNKLTLDGPTLSFDTPKMIFINKDFWNIALLTILVSVYDYETDELYKWLEKILWNWIQINEITFDINQENLDKFKQNNVTNFVLNISSTNDWTLESLRKYEDETWNIWTHSDLFWKLSIACFWLTNNDKLINNIVLKLNNNITLFDLSEWQKKQLLIYFVTNLLVTNNSIILLDEPDSYIHVWNKQRLKFLFDNYLWTYDWEWEVIMTTHSPTLMNKFDKKHLFYLENWKLDLKDKREILDHITDWEMSLNEMEVFLNSWNKYLLVTEWITDKKHLEIAIEKLWIKNNYDIYSADSCDKLTNFLVNLPNGILDNKIIIWIYDYDQAWIKALKKIWEELEENKKYKVKQKTNRFWISLPYTDNSFENNQIFTIEFMYSKEILKKNNMIEYRTVDDINKCIKNQDEKLNLAEIKSKDKLCFYKVSESETSKNDFTDKVRQIINIDEFKNFKALFDLINTF